MLPMLPTMRAGELNAVMLHWLFTRVPTPWDYLLGQLRRRLVPAGSATRIYNGATTDRYISIDSSGHVLPNLDDSQDLGSDSFRWRTLKCDEYTSGNGTVQFPAIGLGNSGRGFYNPTGSGGTEIGLTMGATDLYQTWVHSAGGTTPKVTTYWHASDTPANRECYKVEHSFSTATDASRKGLVEIYVYDTAAREVMAFEANGSAAMLSFYGAAPVVQYSTTGTTTGFSAGTGTGVNDDSTFTGNTGSTAYTIGDIVRALKLLGLIAS